MQTRLGIYFHDSSTIWHSAVSKRSRIWPPERLCHCFTPPRAWWRIRRPWAVLSSCCHLPYYSLCRLCVCPVLLQMAPLHLCVYCSLFLLSGCRYVVHNCSIAVACVWRGSVRVLRVPWQPPVTRLPSQRCNTFLYFPQAHLSPCCHIVVLEPCSEQAGNRRQGLGRLLRRSNRQRGNATAVRQCRAAQLHMLQGLCNMKLSKLSFPEATWMPSRLSTLYGAILRWNALHACHCKHMGASNTHCNPCPAAATWSDPHGAAGHAGQSCSDSAVSWSLHISSVASAEHLAKATALRRLQ